MKTNSQDLLPCFRRARVAAVALTALLAAALPSRALTKVTATAAGGSAGAASSAMVVKAGTTGTNPIVIERFETDAAGEPLGSRKEVAWLGLATDEATEALAAQLKLSPGVGLVVNYVDPQGPAAKAGLEKNDVLVRFENDQMLTINSPIWVDGSEKVKPKRPPEIGEHSGEILREAGYDEAAIRDLKASGAVG